MDDKFTIEELVARLAAKLNILQADADSFVCSFLALIEEGLRRDKYVRIKGFGTFKLIDTDLKDVRIVFVPEASVRDAVNKPFSHFQPVELKDDVIFDDLVEEIVSSSDDSGSEQDKAETKDESVEEDGKGDVPDSDNTVRDDESENPHTPDESKTEVPDTVDELKPEVKDHTGKGSMHWYILVAILFAGIVIGGGIMWGVLSRKSASVAVVEDSVVKIELADTVASDSVDEDSFVVNEQQQDTSVVAPKTIDSIIKATTEDKNEIKFLSDEVAYKINGTIEEYEIAKGTTLSKVAYRYYKNRKLWPYIVMHNKDIIKDPNNVPIGTVLRIPVLIPVE